jgi:hypothetical protein
MKRLVLCALLVGCGGDDSGGGTVALDDLGLQLASTSCAKMFDCCTDAEIMAQFMGITHNGQPITTEAQCVDFANAFFTGLAVAQYKESIAKGRMEYDGAAASDCIAFLGTLSCSEYSKGAEIAGTSTECRPFILPKVANDGACTQDYECVSDNCEGAMVSTGGTSTDGACKPLPTAGEACDSECAEGSYCGYDTTTSTEKCLALKADGAQCSLDRECTSDNCDDTSRMCVTTAPTCDGR